MEPPEGSETQNSQIANYWAHVAEKQELGFWNTPGWVEHQNLLASGTPNQSWLQVFKEELQRFGVSPGHAPLFGRTVANFINDQEGADWAAKILEDERRAIRDGSLSSDFVALLAS